ncbi:MAG: Na+/H+ antiporter NhaA [Desulfobacterales bacterium]|nr:MAG: Na+/H+ antiporter NhaA [Desulfobacterales bacterium]
MAHATETAELLPKEPIDTLVDPFKRFLHVESASGVVLLAATLTALGLANSSLSEVFLAFWKKKLGFTVGSFQMIHSLQHWINDGLMAIFFFVIGLEVKRELVIGELRDLKQATLPILGAIGGMVVPAGIYLLLQYGRPGARGWGIPMATDIAFVVGCLAVLGPRIPKGLRVMLLSLAIADDIGAILVIAIGYTQNLNFIALVGGIIGIAVALGLMKVGLRNAAVYILLMILVWFAFHESGIHATIAGVIFGLLTPTQAWISEGRLHTIVDRTTHFLQGDGWRSSGERYAMLRQMERAARKTISPLERCETDLHPWVGFVIMPLFALANAGVPVQLADFANPVATAVGLGLLAGKPIGIVLFSWLAVKTGLAKLPAGIGWGALTGGGFLAGIGFTMALFIASLALSGELLDAAKVGILGGSVLAATAGVILLLWFLPKSSPAERGSEGGGS